MCEHTAGREGTQLSSMLELLTLSHLLQWLVEACVSTASQSSVAPSLKVILKREVEKSFLVFCRRAGRQLSRLGLCPGARC